LGFDFVLAQSQVLELAPSPKPKNPRSDGYSSSSHGLTQSTIVFTLAGKNLGGSGFFGFRVNLTEI
jgi:hypothetical protein